MSIHASWTVSLGGVVLALTCSCTRPPSSEVSISQAYSPVVKACPLGVVETRIVDVQDTTDGADVIFTTGPQHLQELRTRVGEQAAMYGPETHKGTGHGGMHGVSQAHGMRLWDMPILKANEVDIVGGALLHVVASDPAHVAEVRARVRERVATLEARGCP